MSVVVAGRHGRLRPGRVAMAAGVAALVVLGVGAAPARAAVPQAPPQSCAGVLVADVEAGIRHEADGGAAGNVWALDAGRERARVWRVGAGRFCVLEGFAGRFITFAGTSPGGHDVVAGGVTGSVVRQQRFVVSGTFAPRIPTSGYLGSFDFRCDRTGSCPGNVAFGPLLFGTVSAITGATFTEVAVSRHGGIWVQTDATSVGDITR